MHRLLKTVVIQCKEACSAPAVGLFLIPLIYFPFLYNSFTQAKELSFKGIVLGAALTLLVQVILGRKQTFNQITSSLLLTLLVLQLAWHGFTNFLSANPLVSLYGTYTRGGGFILGLFLFTFLVLVAVRATELKLKKALVAFWAASLLVAFYALLQKWGFDPLLHNYSTNLFAGRVFSTSGNPSLLGQLMLLSLVTSVGLMFMEINKKKKGLYVAGALFFLLIIFLSGTRCALLGLGGIAGLLALKFYQPLCSIVRRKWLPCCLSVALLLGIFWNVNLSERFSLSALSLRSLYSRIEIWKGAVELFERHWVLGYGQDTFSIYFPEVIGKKFYTLEETINTNADRAHNEFLEELYGHGIGGGLLYLAVLGLLLKKFFSKQTSVLQLTLLSLVLANAIQNQLAFPDISIQMLMAFAYGGLVALESKPMEFRLEWTKKTRALLLLLSIVVAVAVGYQTIVRPLNSHLAYTLSQHSHSVGYTETVLALKEAIDWTPYYSELWYELMFIDPSSSERVLTNLKIIDGDSGDLLAWEGNFYAQTDPQKAADFYLLALEKNPYHPNWIRAFADMLYSQGDCETASYLYTRFLEAIPDYWKWTTDLESHTPEELKSYETFVKLTPYLPEVLEKMQKCQST